jgi:hypothetical protein
MPQRPSATSPSNTDRVMRVGAVLVGVGVLCTLVTVLPLFSGGGPLPVTFYLLCFLAPLGLTLIGVALWRQARGRRSRVVQQ